MTLTNETLELVMRHSVKINY